MRVKVTIQGQDLSKEELRHLIQSIRDCEQKHFPNKEIFIWMDLPQLTREEATEILASIKPNYRYGPIHVNLE